MCCYSGTSVSRSGVSAVAGTVLIAPDKFRGSLSAAEAADAIAAGVGDALPAAGALRLPVADGGEGSLLACFGAGFATVEAPATTPLGQEMVARYARRGDVAVIELAEASGLHLAGPSPEVVRYGSTEGTGALVRHAVRAGARTIVLAVGGSATNDAGTGLARALGVRFLDRDGREVPPGADGLARIADVDTTGLLPEARAARFVLAADVAVPLSGPSGAARQFAPQKGAGAADVEEFDAGLRSVASVLRARCGSDVTALPGAGAAGGVGATATTLLGAVIRPGAGYFLDLLGFDALLAVADLVITGEGHVDAQTLAGKAPAEVARRAAEHRVPLVLVAGRISLSADALHALPAAGWAAVADLDPDPDRQLNHAAELLRAATARALRSLPAADIPTRGHGDETV